MPLYTFACDVCGTQCDVLRAVAHRNDPVCCTCGVFMIRRVEPFRASVFEPYYDEALGCDISSSFEKRLIMKALDVVEAGDTVHGARNFDAHAPEHVKPLPLKGIRFRKRHSFEPVTISTVDKDSIVIDSTNFHDLSEG